MPVIRVSDETFRRLQAIAIPLVDSPSSVIDRLLDLHGRSTKMATLATMTKVDPEAVDRLSASGGYLLLAQQGWLEHHLEQSIGREAYYCRGVGAPMKNVAIGAPVFCVQTGEVPHRVHLWGAFGGWEELTPDAAWQAHGTSLGAGSMKAWRELISTIPSLRESPTIGLIRLENVTAASSPISLSPLEIELRQGAMKGRSLTPGEVSRILRAHAELA